MTKQSVINQINRYSDKIDCNKVIEELDSKLKENNLDFNKVISIFTYNRDNNIEFSVLTTPDANIHIIAKKF